jgi:hypothetical protein
MGVVSFLLNAEQLILWYLVFILCQVGAVDI